MAYDCEGMSCERQMCCGICADKSTCEHACKTCVPDVVAPGKSITNADSNISSDEE